MFNKNWLAKDKNNMIYKVNSSLTFTVRPGPYSDNSNLGLFIINSTFDVCGITSHDTAAVKPSVSIRPKSDFNSLHISDGEKGVGWQCTEPFLYYYLPTCFVCTFRETTFVNQNFMIY